MVILEETRDNIQFVRGRRCDQSIERDTRIIGVQAKMLWTKELQGKKSIYVDIFGRRPEFCQDVEILVSNIKAGKISTESELSSMKDNKVALEALSRAVEMPFNDENQRKMLQLLNKAISFAENNSEEARMAYGNRAMCSFRSFRHSLCLNDIAMAELNQSPLLPSVKQLKEYCLETVENEILPMEGKPELSFAADAEIPCFAQGLEVKYSKKYGKHIVTNRKLEIGETVIIEEAFCMVSDYDQDHMQCANCFERMANLIPCANCTTVMFCSQNCYKVGHELFHSMECRRLPVLALYGTVPLLVMRTIIRAIKLFPNIEELIDVIGKFLEHPKNEHKYTDPSIRAYLKFVGLNFSGSMEAKELYSIGMTKMIYMEIVRVVSWDT